MSIMDSSSVTISSTKITSQVNINDKAKLIALVRTWRAKYEKAQALSQHHREIIESLKNDVEQLKEEKNAVTNHLTVELHHEKDRARHIVAEVKSKAAEQESQSNAEKQELKGKLNKLMLLMQNTTHTFKQREAERNEKISDLNKAINELDEENKRIEAEKEKNSKEAEEKLQEIHKENEDLKERYKTKLSEVRDTMTMKVAQMRRQADNMEDKVRVEVEAKVKAEWDEKMAEQTKKAEKIRDVLDNEFIIKEAALKEQNQFAVRNLMKMQADEMNAVQKKMELSKLKMRSSQREAEKLSKCLQNARTALKVLRKNMPNSIYTEIFEPNETTSSKEEEKRQSMKTLLESLSVRMRELKDLRRELERQDQQNIQKNIEDALRMEISHNCKVIEAEHYKKLIRHKQLEAAYRNRRQSVPTSTKPADDSPPDPYFVMMKPKLHSPGPEAIKRRKKIKKNPETEKQKKEEKLESSRSQWLVRENSTVQFNPTKNGKNVWHRPDMLERLKFQRNGFIDKQYSGTTGY